MKQFKNQVIIITGASSGIGKAIAIQAIKNEMNVVMAARNIEVMESIVAEMKCERQKVLIVKTDVAVEAECKVLVDKTISHFGQIDILVNNAGISMRALFDGLNLDVIRQLMDINFWGTVYCSFYALPWLLKSKGSLVGISSIAGYKGLPARTGYSASKFAMHGLLESIRIENLKKGLHVLIACPGFTTSNIRKVALVSDGSRQGESPRNEDSMMSAEEVSKHLMVAISKRKRTLVLSRQGKLTVLLSKFLPALTDTLVYNHMAKEPDSPFK